ncbi:MAG: autotransporter-associated beta strand repeat-containing protein, partial [Thermoguttaceae bacterium]
LLGAGIVTDESTTGGTTTFHADQVAESNFSGVIEDGLHRTIALSKSGDSDLYLSGANTYTGGTTISGSACLVLGYGTTNGSVAGNIADNGALIFLNTTDQTYSGALSGAGSVYMEGSEDAAMTLSGDNSDYTGLTYVVRGTLRLGSDSALGAATNGLVVEANGVLDLNAHNVAIGYLLGSGTVTDDSTTAGTTTFSVAEVADADFWGVIEDGLYRTVALSKSGNCFLNLLGTNTYNGGTTISGSGYLTFGWDTEHGSVAGNILNNGDLVIATGGSVTGNIVDNGALVFINATDQAYSGALSGAGWVYMEGSEDAAMTLSGDNANFTGYTYVVSGTLRLGSDSALGAGTNKLLVGAGGLLDLNSHNVTVGFLLGAGIVTDESTPFGRRHCDRREHYGRHHHFSRGPGGRIELLGRDRGRPAPHGRPEQVRRRRPVPLGREHLHRRDHRQCRHPLGRRVAGYRRCHRRRRRLGRYRLGRQLRGSRQRRYARAGQRRDGNTDRWRRCDA